MQMAKCAGLLGIAALGLTWLSMLGLSPVAIGKAAAQTYPDKPVRLIIPFPPGGSNDIVGRVIAQGLSERLGKAVVVDNRAGAGGIIGADAAAKSTPNGYTILLISSAFTMNSSLHKLTYDPATAFTPIAMLGSAPSVLAVHATLAPSTVIELIALAKKRPGQLRLSSAGVGSYQHLVSEQFRLQTGTDFLIVQYKGGGPALNDLVAGHVDLSVGTIIQTLPFIKSGQLKALAIAGSKRIAALPDTPTMTEAGVDYDASNWWGLLAPAGTPPAIIERLHRETNEVLSSEAVKKRFDTEGAEVIRMGPAELGRLLEAETKRWAKIIKDANITAQ